MKKLYITTAIDYANGKPHIGHAYEKILSDVISRMFRLQDIDVYFLTGLDEHGQKVSQSAAVVGLSEVEHCNNIADDFKNLCRDLTIEYDRYIRTSEEEHKSVVRACLQKLYAAGDIYQASYTGMYSKTAERFVLDKDKVDGEWPTEYGEVTEISEINYFFKLSKYQQWLIDYIEEHPNFIFPKFRTKQVLEFLKDPINDLCISRPKSRLSWGIELPFDKDYVTYVWFDALLNYITGANFGKADFHDYWPADYHVIGKDILVPAHAVYWPIMLHALGIDMPKTLLVHGWWLVSGEKMSKSLGNVVDPMALAHQFGTDAFRYYLMREMTTGQDSDFSIDRFLTRYNCDLANDFGNLVSRILNMSHRYCAGTIPNPSVFEQPEQYLKQIWETTIPTILDHYRHFEFNLALEKLFSCISDINVYIDHRAPWKLAKSGARDDKLLVDTTIFYSSECTRLSALLVLPIMPGIAKKILSALGYCRDVNWKSSLMFGDTLVQSKVKDKLILFPKTELNG